MDLVIVAIRLGQLMFVQEQRVEPFRRGDFEDLIHLDRIERTDLDANLAAHARARIDIENCRIELRFAGRIGLLVLALLYIDTLRRTFLLADLASDAAHGPLGILGVFRDKKRKVPVSLRQLGALLRVLGGDQPRRIMKTSQEVFRGNCEALEDAGAEHWGGELEATGLSSIDRDRSL